MVAFVDYVSTWELWLQDSLPLPSSGSDLNLDGWSFRPNLEPSCHIGGRWTAFLPPPCRRKPSLSSMKTGEAWENPLVWVPPHLACPSLKEESRRVALCPQYLPLPGNPPPLAFLPQDRVGRCDGTQDWSLHSQQGVTDCRAEQSGSSSRAKWMLLTLFAALGCLPWDPRGRSATNGTRRSTSTPQMQPMSFCLLSTRQPDKTLECAHFYPGSRL